MSLPAYLITKRYIKHLKNHLIVPNVAKGSETNFIYINIIRPPVKQSERVSMLYLWKMFSGKVKT